MQLKIALTSMWPADRPRSPVIRKSRITGPRTRNPPEIPDSCLPARAQEFAPVCTAPKRLTEAPFLGWAATPEEQRVKFLNIIDSVRAHPDFNEKYDTNPDPYSRSLAFEKIMKEVMLRRRKEELELYKLHSQDEAFKAALYQSVKQVLKQRSPT